ncbi:MAG TPA: primosomal protein N' [Thermoanaerobaculia bacterium]|jgi:primosomal protein N' (replication factor Y)|nr:primosomal protein N' [Thermoanaerobaculia bacterium]
MPSGLSEFAEVALPVAVHGTFTYAIPPTLRDSVRLGSRVEVPFGAKRNTGFVVALTDRAPESGKIKPILGVLDDDEPALLPEIIDLCRWAADYYIVPLGEMLRTALPANMSARGKREVSLVGDDSMIAAALEAKQILDADVALIEELRRRALPFAAALEASSRSTIERLRDAGIVTVGDRVTDAKGVRYDRFVVLETPPDGLTAKQQQAVELLASRGGEMPVRALENAGVSAAVLGALSKKSVIRIERRARRHTLDAFLAGLDPASVGDIRHSEEQRAAIAAIRAGAGTFAPFLLEGVTGSGKTEVYIELMRDVVRRGEQALLLVPEISLTPVFASRLKERFGERIAILHSSLSASERFDQWWRARRGEVDVAIGPRSALFTPFQRLGLIVVDEEGDSAYKQDESPRYNARDLAVVRAQFRAIPIVLGSATPSLESRENAARGKYTLIRMLSRVESRPLPVADVIDLRKERAEKEDKGFVIFSNPLKERMKETFVAGEQAIILMNRRGYAPYLLCRDCGHDFRCRDCSVTLTVHRRDGLLICHYCGMRKKIPEHCPLCNGVTMQPIGFGTEKVEERFRRDFPGISVAVLDRDSTRKKGELVRILDAFRRQETQALIGTQMLSKGHHFPSVTLTAVLNADSILGYPDFRSAEKTFYLLTQVAGRSGRGDLIGTVLIQSAFPQHYAIQHALRHDYEAFYESEIQFRKTFHYPPVTSMIAILFRGEHLTDVDRAALECGRKLEEALKPIAGTRIQGPAPAPMARIKGVYRYQILLRCPHRTALRKAVEGVMIGKKWKGVEVAIDVDPINIL